MKMQLLVSVRNAEEAEAALNGGADIIDVKEPHQGPLGFAGVETLSEVMETVNGRAPVSAALGECVDWLPANGRSYVEHVRLPYGLTFSKLGLAGLMDRSDWLTEWKQVRRQFRSRTPYGHSDNIAVAYADAQIANAPAPDDVLTAAIATSCAGLLIDTWQKDGCTTFDWLSEAELTDLSERCRAAGIMFALAGRLGREHFAEIRRIDPTIVGVRGAACEQNDRKGRLSSILVAELKASLPNDRKPVG